MTECCCVAICTEDAQRFRRAEKDDFSHQIQRLTLDRACPCRHCLREASAKNGMRLLSYQTPKPQSVYGLPTAVFLRAHACERLEQPNTIADIVNNQLLSFCAFRGDGMMIFDANRIGEGGNYHPIVRMMFGRDDRLHQCTQCQSWLHALPHRASLMFPQTHLLRRLPISRSGQ